MTATDMSDSSVRLATTDLIEFALRSLNQPVRKCTFCSFAAETSPADPWMYSR